MFLYDKKDKSLDVYEFVANNSDLVNYRMEQIKEIPEKERILLAETRVDPYGETPLFEEYTGKAFNDRSISSDYADNEERKRQDPYGRYHVLKNNRRNNRDNEILLDCYNYGYLVDRNVVQIQYPEMMKYYLLKNKRYNYLGEYDGGKNYVMEEIIQLPESLYLLQLLEQGRFTLFRGKNINEQLALYTLSKVNEVSIDELQKMDACGITQEAYSKTINKAERDIHVLKLIKK